MFGDTKSKMGRRMMGVKKHFTGKEKEKMNSKLESSKSKAMKKALNKAKK